MRIAYNHLDIVHYNMRAGYACTSQGYVCCNVSKWAQLSLDPNLNEFLWQQRLK